MKQNNNSHFQSAIRISSLGIIHQCVSFLLSLIYRTIFISYLSKEYLGISGLFSNILQILSLAELGIGSTILFRMYKPFFENDISKIGEYLFFYKRIYRFLFIIVFSLGLCFLPFLPSIVDLSEVPDEINIYRIYFLFVIQSATSYLFVYNHSLLSANRMAYRLSIYYIISSLFTYAIRIIILIYTRDYEKVLISGILSQLFIDYVYSSIIKMRYREVYSVSTKLPKKEKKEILSDAVGLMFHRIGYIVVNGTDNIVLSKICGLSSVGLYSNYCILVNAVSSIISKLLGGNGPIIGNIYASGDSNRLYNLFRRMDFLNMWISSVSVICVFALVNPFISLWLDNTFLFDQFVVFIIVFQLYISSTKIITNSFINGCGLFMKDKLRPIIESVINLSISVVLSRIIGVAGVLIGTIIGMLATSFWREPYLLFKHCFGCSAHSFIISRIQWMVITFILGVTMFFLTKDFDGLWIKFWITAISIFVMTNVLLMLIMHKRDEFSYYKNIMKSKMHMLRK